MSKQSLGFLDPKASSKTPLQEALTDLHGRASKENGGGFVCELIEHFASYGLPQGAQGAPGKQGEPGPQGAAGPAGKDAAAAPPPAAAASANKVS